MFEFAISCGEGTLLDYGIADSVYINANKPDCGYEGWGLCRVHECGDISITGDVEYSWVDAVLRFRPASPDCLTGK